MSTALEHLHSRPGREATALDVLGATYYQHEQYKQKSARSPLLTAYYAVKPLVPRGVQLRLRRRYAGRQATREFPAWPIEPILVERQHDEVRRALRRSGAERVPLVGFWPDRHSSACVLTHDVESARGTENIERLLEIERRHGFVSSWNFVAESYEIPNGTFARLREAGCEIGLHGVRHDGKLFQSRARFESELPKIRAYLESWGAVGFRSPATHRRAEWMHELGCLYDSSFPDTDPFEPQAGGCCSIFPFMFGDMVELPITLVQDHTLWEILERRSIDLWLQKSEWVLRNHGLVNIITHPDYFTSPERIAMYEEFLAFLADQRGCWHALPSDVARWWRSRKDTRCESSPDGPQLVGEAGDRATVMWAAAAKDQIVFDI
jgi:peptidoglycan/xylan/chitin deacetylase (PgdA/CDA1 family)